MMFKRSVPFLVLIVGLAGCTRHSSSSTDRSETSSRAPSIAAGEIGSYLPEFDVKDLEGNEISSKDLRGKVVLVDIWATWCQPCHKEMPGYQKLLDRYGSRGFVVIGLKSNMMMDTTEPIQFARQIGVHYPLVSASNEFVNKFCKLEGLPTTMIYDRNGLLRQKVVGFDYIEHFESTMKPLL